jgi:hypothetical protein
MSYLTITEEMMKKAVVDQFLILISEKKMKEGGGLFWVNENFEIF